ncbi:hypothetical protein [Gluconobacter albidus]|uniref:hypothetical protein n=1 Tax=Gluconobacter albidus TaxID=318683 RepID=UPI001B8B41DA|nr:hypothetical protein [Gluconobacter albidus]MBS1029586.1 hypothetical protein [Gluconobacter albidus]
MTDGPGLGDLFVRRLLNLPGQSCGPSGEARSTTAASHPAFSLTVAVPVRKATARPSAAGVRMGSGKRHRRSTLIAVSVLAARAGWV